MKFYPTKVIFFLNFKFFHREKIMLVVKNVQYYNITLQNYHTISANYLTNYKE